MSGPLQQVELDPKSFRAIANLAYLESGLTLVEKKKTMIQSRLRHRLRALGLKDFSAYAAFVQTNAGQAERRQLISALTTNVSHFFREPHHFEMMCAFIEDRLPMLAHGGRLRVWSAGCSNGQETLSVALALLERFPDIAKYDLRILGTDIDASVIRFARAGLYTHRMMEGVNPDLKDRYFTQLQSPQGQTVFQIDRAVLDMIRYNELNVLGDWPMRQPFDVIFCRNVVIYFDTVTKDRLWPRFRRSLADSGILFLGHSERIVEPSNFGFQVAGATTYRAVAQ